VEAYVKALETEEIERRLVRSAHYMASQGAAEFGRLTKNRQSAAGCSDREKREIEPKKEAG